MPIRVTCPSCHKTLQAPDAAAGKKVRCPGCKAVMAVPAPAAAAAPEPLLDPEPAAPEPSPLGDALAAQAKPAAKDDEGDSGAYGLAAPPPEPGGGGDASDERRRPCPMCGEMIATNAMKCRFCGEVFDATLKRTGAAGARASGVTPTSTNSKAVWALITGILGIFCCQPVLGPTAIILGINARQEIDSTRGAQGGSGLAIAGIILGIIDLVIFVLAMIVKIAGITP